MSEIRLLSDEEIKQEKKRSERKRMAKRLSLWRKKGFDAERSLVKILRKMGYKAQRMPTSGSTSEPSADVVATLKNPPELIAFEVKAITIRYGYYEIKAKQIQKLLDYLDIFDWELPIDRKVALALHFLQGRKTKSPWIVKYVNKAEDVTVHLWDESDMPKLTRQTMSTKIRKRVKKLRKKHDMSA